MESDKLIQKDIVLIRVDGGSEETLGMGHVYRCLNLASVLKKEFKVFFLTKKYPDAIKLIKERRFSVIYLAGYKTLHRELAKISSVLDSLRPKLFIADIRNIENNYIKAIKKKGCIFVYFDDLGRKDLRPDVMINPSPIKRFLDYPSSRGVRYLLGLKYFILNNASSLRKKRYCKVRRHAKRVTMSFGGADPKDCTYKIIRHIDRFPKGIKYNFILGPAYKNKRQVMRYIRSSYRGNNVTIKEDVKDMIHLFSLSDIAVVSGGDTLIEALYARVPTIVVPTIWYEDVIAKKMKKQGYTLKTSQIDHLKETEFVSRLSSMVCDYSKRLKMHKSSKGLVDNNGANRVFKYLKEILSHRF